MSTEQSCPWCGSTAYSTPGTNVIATSTICPKCNRDLGSLTGPIAGKIASTRKSIEEKAIQLCINSGKINAIKYYRTEMNKLPGVTVSLKEAKETVEFMVRSRNLGTMVRPPGRNGYVIGLFLLALIIASIIYFFTHR